MRRPARRPFTFCTSHAAETVRTPMPALVRLVVLAAIVAGVGCSSSRPGSSRSAVRPGPPPPSSLSTSTVAAEPAAVDAPATTAAAPLSPLDQLVARLDSDRLKWSFNWWEPGATEPQVVDVQVKSGREEIGWADLGSMLITGARRPEPFDDQAILRHLVKAMEDPEKTTAAHCELYRRGIYLDASRGAMPGVPDRIEATKPPAGPFLYNWGGLVVELTPTGKRNEGVAAGGVMEWYPCRARIDPAQLSTLRARWQKRLAAAEAPAAPPG
jgi:hypothetical protein